MHCLKENYVDTDKGELLLALTEIGCHGPIMPEAGLCSNVARLSASGLRGYVLLKDLIEKWPELGKGSPSWPIEGSAFRYSGNSSKWDVNTEYGARRYRLLAWLIYTLTKELYDDSN